MNNLKNSVQLIGNLGADPNIKKLDSGQVVANFSLATSSQYKDKAGNKQIITQWHNLVAWGNTATLIEKYLKKGDKVAITGSLSYSSYEDKENIKRYKTEIVVSEFLSLTPKD